MLILMAGTANAAEYSVSLGRYPNTETCAAAPSIDFADDVTISKDYLLIATCANPADFNYGDFVSVWIEDSAGSPIETVSKYEVTQQGIVWVSPLANEVGQAWQLITIDPKKFDCNTTGAQYTLRVAWDAQTASKTFNVFCPTINTIKYREELPYGEILRVEASITDHFGSLMRNVPCKAQVNHVSSDENFVTIKQQAEEILTDGTGKVRFEFTSGFLSDLLVGYDYYTVISCLGADQNFSFRILQASNEGLNNPLYYMIVFVSDNIVAIIMLLVLVSGTITILYLIFTRERM